MASNNPWSDERVAAARQLYADGLSAAACANDLSSRFGETITRNAVIGIWHRKGIGGRIKPAPTQSRRPRRNRKVLVLRPKSNGHLCPLESIATDMPNLRIAEAEPLHLTLEQNNGCKYPYGDGPFSFCGCTRMRGLPYCEPHQILCGGRPLAEDERRSMAAKKAWMNRKQVRAV